jgi:uncharacterized protein YoxC
MELWQLLIVIFTGLIALSNLLLLGAIAYLAFTVKSLLTDSVQPAICEATETIKRVNEMVERVEQKAENILDISEETARRVSGSVLAATDVVQHSVAAPFINLASMVAGIRRAVETLRRSA